MKGKRFVILLVLMALSLCGCTGNSGLGDKKKTLRIIMTYPELSAAYVSPEMIRDFNSANEKYKVEICETALPVEGMEAAVLKKECPDILIMPLPYTVERYANNGLLEDLWPYIEKSETIRKNELPENVISEFERDEHLYSISQRLTIQTLRLRESDAQGMTGWTAAEFVEWLKGHSDTYSAFGISKETVLDYCVKCNLEEFVDFSAGKADFESEGFIELLNSINELSFEDENASFIPSVASIADMDGFPADKPLLMDSAIDVLSMECIPEFYFGEKVINLGYPNAERKNTGMLISQCNLSVYSKSKNKEGAFEFIEYCMTHFPYDLNNTGGIMNQDCQIPTLYSERKKRFDERIGDYVVSYAGATDVEEKTYQIEERHTEELEEIITYAIADDYEHYNIRKVIQDEATPFFAGAVTAQDAARVIQSKAQLVLDENRSKG